MPTNSAGMKSRFSNHSCDVVMFFGLSMFVVTCADCSGDLVPVAAVHPNGYRRALVALDSDGRADSFCNVIARTDAACKEVGYVFFHHRLGLSWFVGVEGFAAL